MGTTPYRLLEQKFQTLSTDSHKHCIAEIGSERGEGSTQFFKNWAQARNIEFHTVDVTDYARSHFGAESGINFHVVDTGHAWCRDVLPSLGKTIKILYLDNFDWIDPNNLQYQWLQDQIAAYAERGVVMSNENSQEEHRLQAMYCLPYMDEQSIILIDDTWQDYGSPTGWNGKCGTAVPLIIEAGYTVIHGSFGVIAYRGVEF